MWRTSRGCFRVLWLVSWLKRYLSMCNGHVRLPSHVVCCANRESTNNVGVQCLVFAWRGSALSRYSNLPGLHILMTCAPCAGAPAGLCRWYVACPLLCYEHTSAMCFLLVYLLEGCVLYEFSWNARFSCTCGVEERSLSIHEFSLQMHAPLLMMRAMFVDQLRLQYCMFYVHISSR